MGLGGGELGVTLGQEWVVALRTVSTDRTGECVCTRVHGSPLRFTHNPLLPVCLFGLGNGGCHGQSPEPAADLLQVALWLLSSPRSCPDPCPLTSDPRGLPCALTRGRAGVVAEGRGDMGIRPGWVVCVWKQILPQLQTPNLTTHNQCWFTCILTVLETLLWSGLTVCLYLIWSASCNLLVMIYCSKQCETILVSWMFWS